MKATSRKVLKRNLANFPCTCSNRSDRGNRRPGFGHTGAVSLGSTLPPTTYHGNVIRQVRIPMGKSSFAGNGKARVGLKVESGTGLSTTTLHGQPERREEDPNMSNSILTSSRLLFAMLILGRLEHLCSTIFLHGFRDGNFF